MLVIQKQLRYQLLPPVNYKKSTQLSSMRTRRNQGNEKAQLTTRDCKTPAWKTKSQPTPPPHINIFKGKSINVNFN